MRVRKTFSAKDTLSPRKTFSAKDTLSPRKTISLQANLSLHESMPVLITLVVILILVLMPSEFNPILWEDSTRVAVRVLSVDNSAMLSSGLIHHGEQTCEVQIEQGPLKGKTATGINLLQGSLETDKVFLPGDRVFAVVDHTDGEIRHVTLIDHYRLNMEVILALLFFALLVIFARGIGCARCSRSS
jgi:uncharacterized membrane protein